MKKILHIGVAGSIMNPFVSFIEENFNFKEHHFYLKIKSDRDDFFCNYENVFLREKSFSFFFLAFKMQMSKKIIVHGLFDPIVLMILFFMPWLLRKTYWVMWGADLYCYQLNDRNWKWRIREFFRRPVIKNIGYLVNGTSGDVSLAREWYGAEGKHIKCFNYPSNIFKEYSVPKKQHSDVNVLVGNSADPSNNHLEIFEKMEAFKEQNIKIYVPLTYGNLDYAEKIIEQGKQRFGDKFEALTEHMQFNQYLEFLGKIDIAIFNHRRQQAFGNTITLLGLGKKVYLNSVSTINGVFKEFDIVTFDVRDVTIDFIDSDTANQNIQKVKKNFSKESLVNSLAAWIQ